MSVKTVHTGGAWQMQKARGEGVSNGAGERETVASPPPPAPSDEWEERAGRLPQREGASSGEIQVPKC